MRALRAFGRFWYDFVVGDDPMIALGVLVAVAVLVVVLLLDVLPDPALAVLGGALVVASFTIAVLVGARRR